MLKIPKSKHSDTKHGHHSNRESCSNSPTRAWDVSEDSVDHVQKEKDSKFSKIWSKNKKEHKNLVEKMESQHQLTVANNAFENGFNNNTPKSANEYSKKSSSKCFKKSFSAGEFPMESDYDQTEVIVYPLSTINDAQTSQQAINVMATYLSSDSSDSGTIYEVDKESKISKKAAKKASQAIKIKDKKSKITNESLDVIYFHKTNQTGSSFEAVNDFPWTVVSYDPEVNQDTVVDQTLCASQLINILSNENLREKIVLVDLRMYDKYCKESIYGAKHFSDFQNDKNQFSMERLTKKFKAIVFIRSKNCDIDISTDSLVSVFTLKGGIKSFRTSFPCFLTSASNQSKESWSSISCFEDGQLIMCEDFSKTKKWISGLNADVIVTNIGDFVHSEVSKSHYKKLASILTTKMSDVNPADFSDKKISDSELMKILKELWNLIDDDNVRIVICTDSHALNVTILVLSLMLKKHWSLLDTLSCITYIQCRESNLTSNCLNVLKNFEKLFFGKRLYSASHKTKYPNNYAFVL